MDELRDMSSKTNSLDGVKEKYRIAIIDNCREQLTIFKNMDKKIDSIDIENGRRRFNSTQYKNAFDNSLGSNDRWGIVSKKNFFGLEAIFLPENGKGLKKDNRLYLRLNSGRFQIQKFPSSFSDFFPNKINISDIIGRSEEEQFAEIEEFYNMNNREVFEKYGVNARCKNDKSGQTNLIANCVVLDSLLQGIGSDIKEVFCWSPAGGYVINIKLEDGTEINANSINVGNHYGTNERGITIKKDGKEARVDFDTISIGKNPEILTNINDLEVENVVYTGDSKLIAQLQQAMQEQFRSQQEITEDKVQLVGEPNKIQEEQVEPKSKQPVEEKIGAEKIIEFMKQNNLEPNDLALALSMLLARTTDKKNAEQHILNAFDKDVQTPENVISEH